MVAVDSAASAVRRLDDATAAHARALRELVASPRLRRRRRRLARREQERFDDMIAAKVALDRIRRSRGIPAR